MNEDNPTRVNLSKGRYILFDIREGYYRIALYDSLGNKQTGKSTSLRYALAKAFRKGERSKVVRETADYIETTLTQSAQLFS